MKSKAGVGSTKPFNGKLLNATTVQSSEGIRENVTKKAYATPCGVPWYQSQKNGLAGGAKGSAKDPICDALPGEEYT